ncbi:MAG TPA: nuclear transport factor 2 family protein [Vicinamibacterales bacterium]|jgi:SnoaL-like protein|nr:nuclear transport factor 2 family protein [Vicinamibacterales bacterium]
MKLTRIGRRSLKRYAIAGVTAVMLTTSPAAGQVGDEEKAAIAVAGSALAAITQGDMAALTDLMLPEAVMFPTTTRDGVTRYRLRTRAEQRAAPVTRRVTERGFRPEARVNGPVATVWYPYDLYVDGQWSHCGVDVFTLIRTDGQWRIATMSWSAVQPPACEKHPDGPPKQ